MAQIVGARRRLRFAPPHGTATRHDGADRRCCMAQNVGNDRVSGCLPASGGHRIAREPEKLMLRCLSSEAAVILSRRRETSEGPSGATRWGGWGEVLDAPVGPTRKTGVFSPSYPAASRADPSSPASSLRGERGWGWDDEESVSPVLEGRFRGACSCGARWNDGAQERSLSPPCKRGVRGGVKRVPWRSKTTLPALRSYRDHPPCPPFASIGLYKNWRMC
jgi:hypothetical protein